MKHYVYRKTTGQILGGCAQPDGNGQVPQITDYDTFGVLLLADNAAEPNLRTQRAATASTLRAATADEVALFDEFGLNQPADPHAARLARKNAETDALLDSVSSSVIAAIAELMKTTIDEVNAGTFKPALWRERVKARVRLLRSAPDNRPSP